MTRPRGRSRGGKGGAEPRLRIRQREHRVMELTVLGRSQHEIAAEVGVSQPAVSKILKRVEERLCHELGEMQDRIRVRHTLRLEHVYGEAMHAWETSKEDAVRRRQRKSETSGGTVAELVSESRHGDARYLEVARRALDDLRQMWGVNTAERLSVVTRDFSTLSDADVAARLAEQDAVYQQLRDAHATVPAVAPEASHG